MGYHTDFEGSLRISRPLTEKERDYINLISNTRRMRRDVTKLMELYMVSTAILLLLTPRQKQFTDARVSILL